MHSFDYTPDKNNPDETISLTCTKEEIEEAARDVFDAWVKEEGIAEAIECVCDAFWKEGEMNASDALMGVGSFWDYAIDNCGFLRNENVIKRAEDKAIDNYLRRGE